MKATNTSAAVKSTRKEKVAHIRLSQDEFCAVEAAAERAGLSVSAFIRSLSLEGAGLRPFLTEADRAIIGLLARDMRAIGSNLNQVARAINAGRSVGASDVANVVADARAVANTVVVELADMTQRAATARRGRSG
ncbi:plasmid mobilization protein [Allomesorhizobium alhagi]|uniref:plasmid mobilization protein n=1 Tax=Allomesorhizobium alhagi TaxID=475067 RepID=UPI000590D7F2|nr:plasmid mobilization relaxosome protein MobC [Mesorhizobium alhagi]